jgi:hypothetical protein
MPGTVAIADAALAAAEEQNAAIAKLTDEMRRHRSREHEYIRNSVID